MYKLANIMFAFANKQKIQPTRLNQIKVKRKKEKNNINLVKETEQSSPASLLVQFAY